MLLHTRIQNVGLVGVETRRTLPLSACRTMCQLQGCDCTPGSQALGLWASIRGEPFLRLRDETFANCKDATVHQDPKRWACGRCSETSSFFFVCVTRPVPTVGMQTVHQDPKRWACGRRSTASPSSVSTVKLTCTGRVLVGPCCIIYQREQATQCTAPGRRLWDHVAPFAPERKPQYGRASLWNHAASREHTTLPKRKQLHSP